MAVKRREVLPRGERVDNVNSNNNAIFLFPPHSMSRPSFTLHPISTLSITDLKNEHFAPPICSPLNCAYTLCIRRCTSRHISNLGGVHQLNEGWLVLRHGRVWRFVLQSILKLAPSHSAPLKTLPGPSWQWPHTLRHYPDS